MSSDETSTYCCGGCGRQFVGLTSLWSHMDLTHGVDSMLDHDDYSVLREESKSDDE